MILYLIVLLACLCPTASQVNSGGDNSVAAWQHQRRHRSLQAESTTPTNSTAAISSESCMAAVNGETFRTSTSISIYYFYEVLTPDEPLWAGMAIESAVKKLLVDSVILESCNSPPDQVPSSLDAVRGIAVGGSSIVSGCTGRDGTLNEGIECYRMIGSNTLFLDEDAVVDVKALKADTITLIHDAFITGSMKLGTEEGIYGVVPLPESALWSTNTGTDSDSDADAGSIKSPGQTKTSSSLDGVDIFGLVVIAAAAAFFASVSLYYWITGESEERVVEEEFSSLAQSIDGKDIRRLRVALSRYSGSEEDISHIISIDYAKPKEMKKEHAVNPFAPREGRTLKWSGVNMTLIGTGDEPDKKILDRVSGEVPKGKTTAVMGSSGSGKSSLLNVLAGRTKSGGGLSVTADVRFDTYRVDPNDIKVRKSIAFVAQDDSLQITATPREAIRFSAKLRLPRSTTGDELDTLTTVMLTELGLTTCADTVVGGPLLKGISGGERKRTSVGVELVVKPAMVFLDEPTSGLDSFSALQCCQVLKKVANAGAAVLFTCHQPSSDIFNSFDHLILLQKGSLLYNGPTDSVADYFGERGHPCPNKYNPADWILKVAQTIPLEELESSGFIHDDESDLSEPLCVTDVFGPFAKRSHEDGDEDSGHRVPGFATQVKLLFAREIRNLKRDPTVFTARIVVNATMSFMLGSIFQDVGETSPAVFINLQSQFGAVVTCSILIMVATGQTALMSFPSERPVFLREYTTDHYSVVSYFTSRLVIDGVVTSILSMCLVGVAYALIKFKGGFRDFYFANVILAMVCSAIAHMIGALAGSDKRLAAELLPVLFTPQILVSGFFVTPSLIPVWIRWVQYLCPLTYVVRILLVSEFYECSTDPREQKNCEQVLNNVGADVDEVWWYWLILAGQFLCFRLVALWLLRRSAQKFY